MPRRIWDMYLSPTLVDRKGKQYLTPEGLIGYGYLLESDPKWYSQQSPSWKIIRFQTERKILYPGKKA